MYYFIVLLKAIVAISILNVWLIQKNKPTRWRGGNAKTIVEEFEVYGLSKTICYIVGTLKVGLALLLIASIWISGIAQYAAAGLLILLLGSVIMHLKIKDPLYKSFPAFLFLVMCALIYFL
jgi:hypothetical protein